MMIRYDSAPGSSRETLVWPQTPEHPHAGSAAGLLFVVAEGRGEASPQAVDTVAQTYYETAAGDPQAGLEAALQAAHARIKELAQNEPDLATTLTAAVIQPEAGQVWLAWVGHSRAYRWSGADSTLAQLTEDHADALSARQPVILVSHEQASLAPGEALLLCTSGVWQALPAADIARTIGESPRTAAQSLTARAKQAGATDSACLLVEMPAPAAKPGGVNRRLMVGLISLGLLLGLLICGVLGAYAWLNRDPAQSPVAEAATATPTATIQATVVLPTAPPSPTPSPAPTESPTPVPSPTPAVEASGSEAEAPPSPSPSPTATATATPTATPSPTLVPTATPRLDAAASQTNAIRPTATPTRLTGAMPGEMPGLLYPTANDVLYNRLEFRWRQGMGCQTLGPGQTFVVRVGPPGQALRPLLDPASQQTRIQCTNGVYRLIIDDAAALGLEPGRWHWDVIAVQLAPYRRLRLSEAMVSQSFTLRRS